jgi:G patch domain-containing protein 1
LGEVPKGYILTEEERQRELLTRVPKLDKDVAIAALGKGASGWMPYADDEAKRARYREFLEYQAGMRNAFPREAQLATKDDWLKELQEFAHCAQIFKPMTGLMATRFTSSSSTVKSTPEIDALTVTDSLLSTPNPKAEDPAEAAAKIGMFGPMTRSTQNFYPSRLLCKRFNVKPPAHVLLNPDRNPDDAGDGALNSGFQSGHGQIGSNLDLVSKSSIDDLLRETAGRNQQWNPIGPGSGEIALRQPEEVIVDPEKNEALEGERAGEAVFRAIFGDDDDGG